MIFRRIVENDTQYKNCIDKFFKTLLDASESGPINARFAVQGGYEEGQELYFLPGKSVCFARTSNGTSYYFFTGQYGNLLQTQGNQTPKVTSDVEINFDDRSKCDFWETENGTVILHNGSFAMNLGSLPEHIRIPRNKEAFLSRGSFKVVEFKGERGLERKVFVCRLEAKSMVDEVISFVLEVKRIKEAIRDQVRIKKEICA